jgi:DNA adenine methylase
MSAGAEPATDMIGPLAYIGGKRRIARQLVALLPAHTTYVEPFAGGAQVFFHKPRSRVEVLNDLDHEIVNFLRVCQRHPQELSRLLRWQPASRRLFEWHGDQAPGVLTDVERAARFFYLQKNTWGGKRRRQNFHFAVTKPPSHQPATLARRLTATADRLSDVQIEALPYQHVLAQYDRPTTVFYCDPPYVGVDLYAHNFSDAQFIELAEHLRRLKGRFLLSMNDCPKARNWFTGFSHTEIAFTYTSTRTPRRFRELLFANYPLPSTLTPVPLVEGANRDADARTDDVA